MGGSTTYMLDRVMSLFSNSDKISRMNKLIIGLVGFLLLVSCDNTNKMESVLSDQIFYDRRNNMVSEQIQARGIKNTKLLSAMREIPRHLFVAEKYQDFSYDDRPLPIGNGQTLSQPYIVALMTSLLKIKEGDKILEIGTGSGYQAAVLSILGAEVFTVEIIPDLAIEAKARLKILDYPRIHTKIDDGYHGWKEHAPFNGIIVTAAPDHVPNTLLSQLSNNGKLIIPVGPQGQVQTLWEIKRNEDSWISINQGAVRFVPFTRKITKEN